MSNKEKLTELVKDAVLSIDTLWGGDVMDPSGTGRFIADSWFSDEPLPPCYTHELAARLRASGGVAGPRPDREAIAEYLRAFDVPGAIRGIGLAAEQLGGLRGAYLDGLARCFEVMWELAQEVRGVGPPVPYERCVRTLLGAPPAPSDPRRKRRLLGELLARGGYLDRSGGGLADAVARWRGERLVPAARIARLAEEIIERLDALTVKNVLPSLPRALDRVPRANVRFLPIENAWFSGSMNYLGRARTPEGAPEYEATYEISAALAISLPEFWQLVSHEVVPGHVTTFAYLQDLFVRGQVGFEASVLTMNTRAATLFEGIANNAILMAYGVSEVSELPDEDLQIGVLLSLLQDDAKNQASYMLWEQGKEQEVVRAAIREDYLLSEERADKLSGAWGRHPLLGRMYLPAYRAGTELVARLRRTHPPHQVLPALFGVKGLVDSLTIEQVLSA